MTLEYKPQNGPGEPISDEMKEAFEAALKPWDAALEPWRKVRDRLRAEVADLVCNALSHSEEVKAEVLRQHQDAYAETMFAWLRESGWNILSDSDKAELRKRITTAYGIAAADNPAALRWAVTTRGDGLAILTFVDDSADRPTGAEVLDPVDSLRFAAEHGWWGLLESGLVEAPDGGTSANWLRLLAWFWLNETAKSIQERIDAERRREQERAEREAKFPVAVAPTAVVSGLNESGLSSTRILTTNDKSIIMVGNQGRTIARLTHDRQAVIAERYGVPVADEGAVERIMQTKVESLRTYTAMRVVRWLCQEGHKAFIHGLDKGEVVHIGGLDTFVKVLGLPPSAIDDVINTFDCLDALTLVVPGRGRDGSVHLLTWNHHPAKGRRPGRVNVTIEAPLCGTSAFIMPTDNNLLCPMPPPPPPISKRPRDLAPELRFHTSTMLLLTDKSRELYEVGGVEITQSDWKRLAEQAELSERQLSTVQSYYSGDNELWPQVLRRQPNKLYRPADDSIYKLLYDQGQRRSNQANRSKRRGTKKPTE